MVIELMDVNDAVEVERLLDVKLAAHRADQPDNPAPCRVHFRAMIARPDSDEETRHYVARVDGVIAGHVAVQLPLKENRHLVWGDVTVDPRYRRRGLGRTLVEHAMAVTRDEGRRTITVALLDTWQDGPSRPQTGKRLLEKLGFTLALTEVHRHSDITAIEAAEEQRLLDDSLAKSQDYETILWYHRPPEELLEPLGKLNSIFIDEAPMGELELEAQQLNADRIRRGNERAIDRGIHMLGVVARRKGETGLAANTIIGVTAEPGDVAYQWITLVDPKHRGHRLGMRVKLENLRQLREQRPRVRRIITGNADVNAHMVAINDALGFTPVDARLEYQIDV